MDPYERERLEYEGLQEAKPAKAGIGLVALLVTVVGGLLWRRRKRK